MNRWHVYEHMKTVFMRTGRVPSRTYLEYEFPRVSSEELNEGIKEFENTVKLQPLGIGIA